MKQCLNYSKINAQTLECRTCAHFCKIKEGKTGICGVRQNINGKLYLLTYGKAVAVHVDPIEKKPLFHFFPGSWAFSLGTVGCNFRCDNCQNFDISQIFAKKGNVEEYGNFSLGFSLSPQQIIDEAIDNKCRIIAYTYTEPTIFLEYCLDTMKLAKKKGLKNVWVSNGFMSEETLRRIVPYLDAINVDIKSFDPLFYKTNCGGKLEPVLDNCRRLVKEKVWLEITTLVIPALSDDEKMLKELARFIKQELGDFIPWHISAFSGAISWKLQHIPSTDPEAIKRIYQIGKDAGLKYVYAGNVWEKELESTYCSRCGELVVDRIGYEVKRYDTKGKCPKCGEKVEGFFN